MADEKRVIVDGQVLENISGGEGEVGYTMTVGDCNGGYLAMRAQPVWDPNNILAQLNPGNQVFTYGVTTNGTGIYGSPCNYTYVCFNNQWGWAYSDFLR